MGRRIVALVVAVGVVIAAGIVAGSYGLAQLFPADTRVGAFTSILAGTSALSLAVLTGVLLVLNWQVVRATHLSAEATEAAATASQVSAAATQTAALATQQAATATSDEADATREEAAASREATLPLRDQVEREWRPIMVLSQMPGDMSPFDSPNQYYVWVANLGRGPAVNCLIALFKPSESAWRTSSPFALGGSQSDKVNTSPHRSPVNADAFDSLSKMFIRISIYCEVAAGIWYRFTPPSPTPEIWRQGTPQSDWVPFYRAEIPGRM